MRESTIQYFQLFFEIKGDSLSDKAAYLTTEEKWEETHGFPKYTSFGSFRVMKYRYLKKLLRFGVNCQQS